MTTDTVKTIPAQPRNVNERLHDQHDEKAMPISITVSPGGAVSVTVEYLGTLASIGPAIERLRASGVVELVQAQAPAPSQARRKAITAVQPSYNNAGDPCCPVHNRALTSGRFGLYCSAKVKEGEEANSKGYCALRFT